MIAFLDVMLWLDLAVDFITDKIVFLVRVRWTKEAKGFSGNWTDRVVAQSSNVVLVVESLLGAEVRAQVRPRNKSN